MDFPLTIKQQKLIELVRELGHEKFAPRASWYDQTASFPFENYQDLREHGLLALTIPEQYGGLGADFPTYCLVSSEIGRYCGATALTYNMHTCSLLWTGILSNDLPMKEYQRIQHHCYRQEHFRRVVEEGAIYAQPISEEGAGVSLGKTYQTNARKVDGGWIINGKKVFASLSGAANYYGVICTKAKENASLNDSLYLAIPANAEGVKVVGDWNPVGMRATVSRTLIFDNVFVPDNAQLLPENLYFQMTKIWPHMFLTLTPTYVGISQAAYDFTVKYLRGEIEGIAPIKRRQDTTKQYAVAEMFIKLEQMKSLFYRAIHDAKAHPSKAEMLRAYATNYTVMEYANELCSLALRVCGGQALLKSLPLERLYRDSICGSVMRPWSIDRCLERLGRETLYEVGETDENTTFMPLEHILT
ncbi:MAG: acyl-CoA/acyl-ACP dehydrogenase (plasmid) [Dolichospermum sp. DET50]|jgi:alkylation response protein AidB-like acyl-CoA dehydrogenase|nr:acyl-CoA/acyl-ACP dehydrogenase [Dolichospermum sp. DET66]MBS3035862.1 acyl-CoA/acyl-ACP dehydrogenase [Dolichospermum sp. DET67]MBS3041183.1 acyl-CoA/acyl-ACP dehydrogenase [Dolichospermum sp. DET50]QSX70920.1 MAG: acyl-CoA/acyl-ACP dehydrogenase [Dolichospermum sp. DET69]MBS3030812.1 acyl-CoA/acyl-ACP dehydrogenase [Dolichospermum sp. DET66]